MDPLKRKPILEDWPGAWGSWAGKFCTKNKWRVENSIGDYEDCMADCAMIFIKCKRLYGAAIDEPKWFMALYQRWIYNHFHDASVADTRYRETNAQVWVQDSDTPIILGGDMQTTLEMRANKGSDELKMILNIIFNAPPEIISTISGDLARPKRFLRDIGKHLGFKPARTESAINELYSLLTEA